MKGISSSKYHQLVNRAFYGRAFTLIELLLSMTVLSVLLLIMTSIIGRTQKSWTYASARTTQFREARAAFDLLTRFLSQATLNAYWDYDQGGMADQISSESPTPTRSYTAPKRFIRQSELGFFCGQAKKMITDPTAGAGDAQKLPFHAVFFQAPLGVTEDPTHSSFQNLLTGRGYFIQFENDAGFRPPFVKKDRFRYRLMEYSPSTESNLIYANYKDKKSAKDWFEDAGKPLIRLDETTTPGGVASPTRGYTRPVAENIIALILAPKVSRQPLKDSSGVLIDPYWIWDAASTDGYTYDSTKIIDSATSPSTPQGNQHLLPPLIDVIMIAIDEPSALRLADKYHDAPIDWEAVARFDEANAGSIAKGIRDMEKKLLEEKLNYRVFSATIEIRGSRWSLN